MPMRRMNIGELLVVCIKKFELLCVLLVWFQRNLVVHLFLQFAISYRGVAASLEIYCGSLSVLINECYIENWGLVGLLLK